MIADWSNNPQALAQVVQDLIRFDTTNPPGNEAECITYIHKLLVESGFPTTILARAPGRPNLITRLKGRGTSPPLLLYAHVDVVTAAHQEWEHPPFEGREADGHIWGRGALDMKGGLAMMLAALLRAKIEGLAPAGDVMLAALSDEEAGGEYGAKYLVEAHRDLFETVRYAIGELGGFTFHFGGKRFYPIMVAEKQLCWMRATLRGPGGHGSMPARGGAMARLGRLIQGLDRRRLPVHITPVARQMINALAADSPLPTKVALRAMLNPVLTDEVLTLLGDKGGALDPLLHNTVNATVVRAGDTINVVPTEVSVELDGRLLPGYEPDDMTRELRLVLGEPTDLQLLRYDPGPAAPDMGLFPPLAAILREADPSGTPVPYLLAGTTDGRFFSRLGIQTYGFLPMRLPKEMNFTQLFHGANERIPIEALTFGANALYQLLRRFGTAQP